MITASSNQTLKQSQEFTSYSFGIKQSGIAHIFNVLRNQLYSDKVLAVIREYSTNAVDAHIEVGKKDTPIRITLPNLLSLDFKVRDYGRGLTEREIGEIYAMYGESTKRGTNEQIGQLGLGCKSAFAYGDNFIINSFIDGTRVSYNAFIDPSQVGKISKMEEELTKEPNGVEIVIPVKRDDVDEFYTKAVGLYKFFDVKPEIHGCDSKRFKNDTDVGAVVFETDTWKVTKENRNESTAIMGNISYPIDEYALNLANSYRDETGRADLLGAGVIIRFGIGDLDISASREALQYTDGTKDAIIKKLDSIIKEVPSLLSESFKDCKTLWDAKVLYDKAFSYGGFGDRLRKIADKQGVNWNGVSITDNQFGTKILKQGDVQIWHWAKHRTNRYSSSALKRVKGIETGTILVEETSRVVEEDRITHTGRSNRIAPLIENYEAQESDKKHENVYLIKFNTPAIRKKWMDATKFDGDIPKMSDLTPIKLNLIYPRDASGNNSGSYSQKSTKHTSKEFIFDFDCTDGRWSNKRSNFFQEAEVDLEPLDESIYLKIDKFYVCKANEVEPSTHPNEIKELKEALAVVGIEVPEKVYAFKPKKYELIEDNSNWVSFFDWARENLKAKIVEADLEQRFFDRFHALKNMPHFLKLSKLEKEETKYDASQKIADDESPLKMFLLAHEGMLNRKHNEELDVFQSLSEKLGLSKEKEVKSNSNKHHYGRYERTERVAWKPSKDLKPTFNLPKMIKEANKRYELFKYIDDSNFRWEWSKEFTEKILNYVNMVDATYVIRGLDNIFEEADKVKEAEKIA